MFSGTFIEYDESFYQNEDEIQTIVDSKNTGENINKKFVELLNKKDLSINQDKVESGIQMIVEGASINTKNNNGDTFLHILVKNEEWIRIENEFLLKEHWITEKILDLFAVNSLYEEFDFEAKDSDGYNPLQLIMHINNGLNLGYRPFCLIDAGFSPGTLDKYGDSLLHLYAKSSSTAYLNKLLDEYRLDINTENNLGLTPLDYLLKSENYSQLLKNSLVQRGARQGINNVITQFKKALHGSDKDNAFQIFCKTNKISCGFIDPTEGLLGSICSFIQRPVHSIFIIKLLEYEKRINCNTTSESGELAAQQFISNCIKLFNISHLIQNWELVETQMTDNLKTMTMDINSIIYFALDAPKSHASNKLLKMLFLEVQQKQKIFVLLPSIVKQTMCLLKNCHVGDDIRDHLFVLDGIFKRMAIYNRVYFNDESIVVSLKELVTDVNQKMTKYASHSLIDTLEKKNLIEESRNGMEKQIETIIQFAQEEKRKEQLFSKFSPFFFSENIPFPKDVKREIIGILHRI